MDPVRGSLAEVLRTRDKVASETSNGMEDQALMNTELEKEWEKSYKRRVQKRHRERLKKTIAIAFSLILLTVVLIGFECFKKGEKFIRGERALSPEEWSYYASLKNKAKDLEDQQVKIRVYERLLEKFKRGELQGYARRDSVIWAKSSLELKRKFNQAVKDSKYNSIMNLVLKFSDPDHLPKDFTPLPTSFMPYVLSEHELGKALQNPEKWVDYPPDSTEQKQKDAH